MDGLLYIYVLNLIVMVGMFVATIYRTWIEKQNLDARNRFEKLKYILQKDENLIKNMSGEEFIEMLRMILGEN